MNRFLDQLEIQPDALCLNIARAPPGFHLSYSPLCHLHTDDRLPFSDQGSNLLLESLAIPGDQYALTPKRIASGLHEEIHSLVVANDHCWRAFVVQHIK